MKLRCKVDLGFFSKSINIINNNTITIILKVNALFFFANILLALSALRFSSQEN